MNTVIQDLWRKLYNHPHCSDEVVNAVLKEIKVGVAFGADKFTLTRNMLTRTLDLLDMTLRIEERNS